jgi:predicted DNA-binding transcriptional regulator AlpA
MAQKTYTTAQVAKMIRVSRQTLHTWIKNESVAVPKPVAVVGGRAVRLWTKADVERVQKFKGSTKRGRKAK